MAEKWEETIPATLYGIEEYLCSGLIKGVGPKCAKQVVSVFGLDTIAVIEDSPDRLLTVPGIGKKRVGMIRESWERQKEVKNNMLFLQGYGVSTAFTAKIYKAYDESNQLPSVGAGNVLRDIIDSEGCQSDTGVFWRSGLTYRLNDRVLQIKNSYGKEVFNGDIGNVREIDLENRTFFAAFDNRVIEYEVTELDELTRAKKLLVLIGFRKALRYSI